MCVILVVKDGGRIDEDVIEAAATANPDGLGLAWVNPEREMVRWRKGLTDPEAVAKIVMELQEQEVYPFIVHARIATSGGVLPELTHPFPISKKVGLQMAGEAPSVLFHNGVWPSWRQVKHGLTLVREKIPEGAWSDTRLLALMTKRYPEQAEMLWEKAGKVAVLAGDGELTLHGDFEEIDKEVYASNTLFAFYTYSLGEREWDDGYWRSRSVRRPHRRWEPPKGGNGHRPGVHSNCNTQYCAEGSYFVPRHDTPLPEEVQNAREELGLPPLDHLRCVVCAATPADTGVSVNFSQEHEAWLCEDCMEAFNAYKSL